MYHFSNRLFLIVCIFGFIISGCEQSHDSQSKAIDPPKNAGVIRIPLQAPVSTVVPSLAFSPGEGELVDKLFLSLTDFNPKTYEVVPELATQWQPSKDGTVYTFQLRQDVKWTDGEPVTAHDIVWAIQRNLAPETKSPFVNSLFVLKNAEAIHKGKFLPLGVRAIDDYTVEFTLKHTVGYFPALVSGQTYSPLPRQLIEKEGKKWTEPAYIQTNGPYHLTNWDKGNKLILQKNPHYYEANKVKIPVIHYLIIQDSELGLAMYEKNKLDIIGGPYLPLPRTKISYIKANTQLRREVHHGRKFCTRFYGFNTQKPPMDNPLVRKAIAAAIDRQTLDDFFSSGINTPATTFIPPPIFGSVDPDEQVGIQFKPEQAKIWLKEAGYPDGKGFPKDVVLMNHVSKDLSDMAKAIKIMLKRYLNIEIKVSDGGLDFNNYHKKITQPTTPHIFLAGFCTGYPDANDLLYGVFHPTQGLNRIGWNNSEFADVVEKAQRSSNQAERKQLYRRAEEILTQEEAAIVPIYFINDQFLVKPRVKGWYNMAFGGQHVRNWYLED
jgi:ABC-type oligopeptide transport system substrate-binding subunit